MADSVVDFASMASTDTGANSGVDSGKDTSVVDSGTAPETEALETGSETDKTEGSEKTSGGTGKETVEPLDDEKFPTPQAIRSTLRNIRESADPNTPEGKATLAAVKALHNNFERWNAAKEFFPKGFSEMKDAAAFIKEIGGREGYSQTQAVLQSVQDIDELLYNGDPKLWDNVVDDLKNEGKLDALGKLAPAFLDKLRESDPDGYFRGFAPHFLNGLRESNVPQAINQLYRALVARDSDTAKEIVQGMANWYKGLQEKQEKTKSAELDPERKAFAKERAEFEQGKIKERNTEIATTAEKSNNELLGTALRPYLKMPFFKGFTRANLIPLGNLAKQNLHAELRNDKAYQTQMKAFFAAKTPDKAKIAEYHRAAVESRSERIMRATIQTLYPGYAKGGSAAGRIAAVTAKKAAEEKANAAAVATGKPIYVPQKPKWEAVDWDKDPKQLLYIAGKAFLKGSGKFVTWRR